MAKRAAFASIGIAAAVMAVRSGQGLPGLAAGAANVIGRLVPRRQRQRREIPTDVADV